VQPILQLQLPPPPTILVPQASSAISSVTNPATSTATNDDADGDTPKKRNVLKQKFPDFSQAYSEENPFLSGDESDQWEAEEENIAAQVAMGNALEELAASELSDPVEEVQFNGCYGVARPFVGVGFSDSQQQG